MKSRIIVACLVLIALSGCGKKQETTATTTTSSPAATEAHEDVAPGTGDAGPVLNKESPTLRTSNAPKDAGNSGGTPGAKP